ncbi:uncharacterized protein B0P05DRAFT_527994, partial [Gilbertella persicaria]
MRSLTFLTIATIIAFVGFSKAADADTQSNKIHVTQESLEKRSPSFGVINHLACPPGYVKGRDGKCNRATQLGKRSPTLGNVGYLRCKPGYVQKANGECYRVAQFEQRSLPSEGQLEGPDGERYGNEATIHKRRWRGGRFKSLHNRLIKAYIPKKPTKPVNPTQPVNPEPKNSTPPLVSD